MDIVNNAMKAMKPNVRGPRTMKFPYTLGAQIAQFPFKYYWTNQWFFRYWFYGIAATFPLMVYIHNLANSPANVAKWAEIRRKEKEEHHH